MGTSNTSQLEVLNVLPVTVARSKNSNHPIQGKSLHQTYPKTDLEEHLFQQGLSQEETQGLFDLLDTSEDGKVALLCKNGDCTQATHKSTDHGHSPTNH